MTIMADNFIYYRKYATFGRLYCKVNFEETSLKGETFLPQTQKDQIREVTARGLLYALLTDEEGISDQYDCRVGQFS